MEDMISIVSQSILNSKRKVDIIRSLIYPLKLITVSDVLIAN